MMPILGYWDFRGIANPIRMLLDHLGVPYEMKEYQRERPEMWYEGDKVGNIGSLLTFPNLPYYIDSDIALTQSKVILVYLGEKYGLGGGGTTGSNIRLLLGMEAVNDLQQALDEIAYAPTEAANSSQVFDFLKTEYLKRLPGSLTSLTKFLGTGMWMGGELLSWLDFYIYDILDYHRILFRLEDGTNPLTRFTTLLAYMERFEGLSGVKAFLRSGKFSVLPIYTEQAMFGNEKMGLERTSSIPKCLDQLYKSNESCHVRVLQILRFINKALELDESGGGAIPLLFKDFLHPNSGEQLIVHPPFRCINGYNLTIGDGTEIGQYAFFQDKEQIRIGRHILIAAGIHVYTEINLGSSMRREAVTIGDYCWIGGQVVILPGVTIGEGSTIGAGSVVTTDVPPRVVVAGNPAKIIRYLPTLPNSKSEEGNLK